MAKSAVGNLTIYASLTEYLLSELKGSKMERDKKANLPIISD